MRERWTVETLLALGARLDAPVPDAEFETLRGALADSLLRIRTKDGSLVPLRWNAAQRMFERRCGQRNIVLKARQLGMTTWLAARNLLDTITHRGWLTVLVAQDSEAAEAIFGSLRSTCVGWWATGTRARCKSWNSA